MSLLLTFHPPAKAQTPNDAATADRALQRPTQQPRITQPIDDKNLVVLHGNTHPLARPEFDRGPAPLDLRLDRMLLVLKRSPEQDAALQKLLEDQQDKSSPQYRQWLTPEQFGQQFGPADSDIQQVTDWLQGHGFQNVRVSKGRVMIEFSGTVAQVEIALGTSARKFSINGEDHWANASDPSIPSALSPVVHGVFTLHNFYKHSQVQATSDRITATIRQGVRPQLTSSSGLHALVPADYYTIYNFKPAVPVQSNSGARIAIVGRSNINAQDVIDFHSVTGDHAFPPIVIVNGPDPGDLGGAEEVEAVLDTTWAGAVAPAAWVGLVVSQSTPTTDGVDLSELYIIDNNLADVMSESFGGCEANSTSAQAMGIASLAQQAAAQGITYVVAAGDSGAAGCDDPNTQTVASGPLSVNILASTPYTVAVGGTMFNENGHNTTYWSSSNDPTTLASALSYIPEDAWNESCAAGQSGCKPGIWAGGGGASTFFAKPPWQTGVLGIPTDNTRDLPDISLTSAAHDPYLLCIQRSCVPNAQGQINFIGVGGTSAATPAFAGIMALVGQKTLVRLGQPNYVLYRLAAAENLSQCNASSTISLPPNTCVFNDVTSGNNAVPGEAGYGTPTANYQTAKGYDLATGLGSVNVTALINQWNSVTFSPTTTSFSISPVKATHGDPLNVVVSVTPNSGTGKPTGSVWLTQNGYQFGNLVGSDTADIFTLDAQATFTGVTHLLPGGTYTVNAHYAGDGTYASSDSSPPVQVTIQPESTTTTFSALTMNTSGNFVPFTGGPYGSQVFLQAHVSGQSGYGVPTGAVNFWDKTGFGAPGFLDKQGNALTADLTLLAVGLHSFTAVYIGDTNFAPNSNLTPVNFSITPAPTTALLTPQLSVQGLLLTATISASGLGALPTGVVTFNNGSTALGTASLPVTGVSSGSSLQVTATFDGTHLAPGQYSIIASYAGDADYAGSSSAALPLNLQPDFIMGNGGPQSQTLTDGQTAFYPIVVTPLFGFSSTVTASCTVPAVAATCSVSPNSYATANGVALGTVTVTTTAPRAGVLVKPERRFPLELPAWPVTLLVLFLLCSLLAKSIQTGERRFARALVVASLTMMIGLKTGGCGGGGNGTGNIATPPPTPQPTTAVGTYTVTVTASSASVTHTMTLTLIVQ